MLLINQLFDLYLQVAVSDPNKFNVYMIAGYAAMWIIAMVYILSLANRQRNVGEELKLLKQLLTDDEEAERS